jgi:pyridoxal phosphate enzyme (YggS family)
LLAISKGVPSERIREALDAGQREFGENRAQEAASKFEELGESVTWHFVGNLQRNKVKLISGFVSLIHSLDRLELAQEISNRATRDVEVLIEVNSSGEEAKSGIAPEALWNLLDGVAEVERVNVTGLMTMAPLSDREEASRPYFRLLASLLQEASTRYPELGIRQLSMGMSQDYRVAVEEGATIVRVGRAIFGATGI